MTQTTLRDSLTYLWDQHYTITAIAAEMWHVLPPSTGASADLPPLVATAPTLVALASLHQMLDSQAMARTCIHIPDQVVHGGAIFQRLGWTCGPCGDGRWKLHAPAGHEMHPDHGRMVGASRLWSSALELEQQAIAALWPQVMLAAHIIPAR
jgi:hypothetical protein